MKTTGGNSDYDARIGVSGGSSSTSGQGVLTFNSLSCTINSPLTANSGIFSGITNNSTLSQVGLASFSNDIKVNTGNSVYITNSAGTYFLRMHHSGVGGGAYIDCTGGLNLRNSTTSSASPTDTFNINSLSNEGTFNYNLNTKGITNSSTAGITNNGILTQNLTCNINSVLNVSGNSNLNSNLNVLGNAYFVGTSANFLLSTTYSSKNGLEIYWDVQHPQGESVF